MRFGIPEYRLPRTLLRAEIDRIVALGVDLRLSSPLGPAFGVRQLREQGFEAVFLSVGVSSGRDLQAPGVELDGVVKAVDYLLNVNRGYRMDLGRRVVVIGGGFVAFDAARTAIRAGREAEQAELGAETDARVKEALDSARAALRGGATEVTVVSLESFDEMPVLRTTQGHEEFEEAQREGVRFVTRRGPRRFLGDGHLSAVELRGVRSVFDETGRFAPQYADDDTMTIDADACILAIGQKPDLSFLTPADGVELKPGGTIRIDPATLATTAPGIYAGGDVAFGPRNLIEAVANGKRAASSIHEYLAGQDARLETHLEIEALVTSRYRMSAGFERLDREAPPTLDVGRRTGIAEVETGYDALRRAAPGRALSRLPRADHLRPGTVRALQSLRGHLPGVPPVVRAARRSSTSRRTTRAAMEERAQANGSPLTALIKDDDRCIRCGLCAIRCPTEAMTMERFTITERWTTSGGRLGRARSGQRGTGERTGMSTDPKPRDRRDFLLKLGTGAGVAAITAQAAASLRSLVPNVSYDAPTTVKLGPPAEFPDGLKFLPDERLLVFREGNTFHAISAVCTHLGCTVRAEALSNPQTLDVGGARHARHAPLPLSVPRLAVHAATAPTSPARRRSRWRGSGSRCRPTTASWWSTSPTKWATTSA